MWNVGFMGLQMRACACTQKTCARACTQKTCMHTCTQTHTRPSIQACKHPPTNTHAPRYPRPLIVFGHCRPQQPGSWECCGAGQGSHCGSVLNIAYPKACYYPEKLSSFFSSKPSRSVGLMKQAFRQREVSNSSHSLQAAPAINVALFSSSPTL